MSDSWVAPPLPTTRPRFENPEDLAAYEARCAFWESLTHEDIWGTPVPPPLPPLSVPVAAP